MGMEGAPKYVPTPEEMTAAEESMTPEQERGSIHRESSFEEIKALFEKNGISLENLRNIDIKLEELHYSQGPTTNKLSGTINGHEVSIEYSRQNREARIVKGVLDGIGLTEDTSKSILEKYRHIARPLEDYNRMLKKSREAQKKEQEGFDEQQKIGAALKDIL